MYLLLVVFLALVLPSAAWAAQSKASGKATKAPAGGSVKAAPTKAKAAAATQNSPHKQNSLRSAAVRRGARPAAARPPRYQLPPQPTQDRYKEIQTALASKGYFQGAIDGVWGPDSLDALKRFQKDQNLSSDGKLSALSLIAMGLGAQRSAAPVQESMTPASVPPAN